MVVAGIAIDDVEILDFIKVVLGGIGRINTRHTGVETATEDGRETSLLEALLVGPLPGILEVCLVLGLVVGRIEVGATALQAGFHDGEVLIRQGQVHDEIGLELVHEGAELFYAVGIHLCCLDVGPTDGLDNGIAL